MLDSKNKFGGSEIENHNLSIIKADCYNIHNWSSGHKGYLVTALKSTLSESLIIVEYFLSDGVDEDDLLAAVCDHLVDVRDWVDNRYNVYPNIDSLYGFFLPLYFWLWDYVDFGPNT